MRDLRIYHPVPHPALRLVCFPHAGAGAPVFRSWGALVPPWVEVVCVAYPGRQDRVTEPAAASLPDLAATIAAGLNGPVPTALFGHSMGALVAFEVAHALARPPVHLFVSAHHAPGHRAGIEPRTDADIVELLRRLGGVPDELLDDAELRELVLGPIRADHRLLREYEPAPRPPLSTPITTYVGADDPVVDVADLAAWAGLTTAAATARVFPGGHFYLHDHPADLIADVATHLRDALVPGGLPR